MRLNVTKLALSILLVFHLVSAAAMGDFLVSIGNIVATPTPATQTGSFEVFVSTDQPQPLVGYQFKLALLFGSAETPATLARFTSVETPAARNYAFAPNSASPIGVVSGDGTTVQIGDFLLSGSAQVDSDEAFALVRYEIFGGFLPDDRYRIAISTDPNETFFAIDNTQRLAFTTVDGQILGVPEPNSASLLVLFGILLASRRGHRKFNL